MGDLAPLMMLAFHSDRHHNDLQTVILLAITDSKI